MRRTSRLLLSDRQFSVMNCAGIQSTSSTYDAFGFSDKAAVYRCRFSGQYQEPKTGHYLLGNGYRSYSPGMKIFFSPDNFSPFAKGGLNSYVYCTNDPINNRDPSGHYALTNLTDDAIYNVFNGRLRKALAADRNITTAILAGNLPSDKTLVDRLNKVANSEYLLRHRRNDNIKLLAQTNPTSLNWSSIQEYSNNKMLINHIEKQSPLQSKVLIATKYSAWPQ